MKEIKALVGNIYPGNIEYLKFRNFYRFYLVIYLLLFGVYFSIGQNAKNNKTMEKIEVGSLIPQFSLNDQNGDKFDIGSVLGKKNLVIFFYPKDDSPGCTKEACYFRDQFAAFQDANAAVIGISGQSVASHKAFAQKHNLSYTLLSDHGNRVRKLFGVPTDFFGILPGRVTYIVDKSGKVVHTFSSQTEVLKHVDEALEILKKLQ